MKRDEEEEETGEGSRAIITNGVEQRQHVHRGESKSKSASELISLNTIKLHTGVDDLWSLVSVSRPVTQTSRQSGSRVFCNTVAGKAEEEKREAERAQEGGDGREALILLAQ